MATDGSSIFSQYLQPVRSVQDYQTDQDKRSLLALQLQGQQGQNALLDITRQQQMQASQAAQQKQNAIQALYADPLLAGDPSKLETEALRKPMTYEHGMLLQKERLANAKTQAEIDKQKADAGKTVGETADGSIKRFQGMLPYIDTPQSAARWLAAQYQDPALSPHMTAMGTLDDAVSRIPQDPQAFAQWRQQAAMGMDAYAKHLLEQQKVAETGRHNVADEKAKAATTGLGYARLKQELSLADRPVIHDTDAGPALISPRAGTATLVNNPATGQPFGKPLKDIPQTVNTAIIDNRQSLAQLDRALALVGGQNVGDPADGGMQGDKAATGIKGYIPQTALNYLDPQGVDTRAQVADIGSLKLHDRSGAAITASESPRLMPFIPTATDDAATVKKKLSRLRMEVEAETRALADTYSKEQGYKPNPLKPIDVKAATQGGNSVTTPDGKVHTFPNAAAAAAFKKAAGL